MDVLKDWDEIVPYDETFQLPAGGYVCKIYKAEEIENDDEHYLNIYFDIAQGAYKGFYERDYKYNSYDERKWRGVMRAYYPADNGTPKDDRTKSRFKGFITALEKSNDDFEWHWKLADFNDMYIGIVFRYVEWEKDGLKGTTACPFMARSIEAIQEGRFKIPQPKVLANKNETVQFEQIDDEINLPF